MNVFLRYTFILLTCLFTYQAASAGLVKIVINGNIKTHPDIIKQEMLIVNGEQITQDSLEQSRQSIMDLGLFEHVEISSEPEQGQDGHTVFVTVKEKKHDWYVLPRIDRSGEGDIALGLNWRENNLNGLNQTSKLTVKHKKFKDSSKDEELSIGWQFIYPRIVNTKLSMFVQVEASQVGLEEERDNLTGSYEREEYLFGAGIGRWFSPFGTTDDLHALIGLEYDHFQHDYISGSPSLYDDASFVSLFSNISYNKVEDHLFSQSGFALGLRLKHALEGLGSDREFFHQRFYYKNYKALSWRKHSNLNLQVQLGAGDESLFGDPIFELSGSRTLRGYPRETLEGDAFFLVNTEFLTPILGRKHIRAAAFFDFGNAYDHLSDISDTKLEYGAGFGVRWKFKRWVGAELRIDVAKGFGDEGDVRVYAASEATF